MKRNARNAFNALKRLDQDGARNVHVIDRDDNGAHFLIGCEARTDNDEPVGDYYQEIIREHVDDDGKIQNAFGIRTVVHEILDDHGLYAEWVNPGLLGVYSI